MITPICQRWSERRARRVGSGTTIDPDAFTVDLIEEPKARAFVLRHHYSGSFPAARLSAGLYRRASLVGVAVFSEPMNGRVVPRWTGLTSARQGAELGRLVLLDDVAGDGETWFLKRAFSLLRREKRAVEAIVSYADPEPRRDAGGALIKPGHIGTVYQSMSARYRGRSGARTAYRTCAGHPVSGRALSKIRLEERGLDYAAREIEQLGAAPRRPHETGAAWIDRLLAERFLSTARHPGNHVYVFPLNGRARAAARRFERVDYPRIAA